LAEGELLAAAIELKPSRARLSPAGLGVQMTGFAQLQSGGCLHNGYNESIQTRLNRCNKTPIHSFFIDNCFSCWGILEMINEQL
jgi:hypothetical protein